VVSVQIYVGDPITCWAPKHFTDNHIKYTNSYCWIRNTYYLPFEEEIPKAGEHRDMVTYYQWVPFILLAMAGLFYLPNLVWHGLNQRSGVDADNILTSAQGLTNVSEEENRATTLTVLTNLMDRFLGKRRLDSEGQRSCKGFRRFGSYLVLLYLLVKLLYILNVFLQFFLLDTVLTTQFETYGFDVMGGAISDTDWTLTPRVPFPRVTLCDFQVRRLGNVHRYTVQCTLPINLYNEKIFLFLWFWLIFVCLVNIVEFFSWTFRGVFISDGQRYIRDHLQFSNKLKVKPVKAKPAKDKPVHDQESSIETPYEEENTKLEEPKTADEFVEDYLKRDGVFLLRLIGHNTNKITVNELIVSLWDVWLNKRPPANVIPLQKIEEKKEFKE